MVRPSTSAVELEAGEDENVDTGEEEAGVWAQTRNARNSSVEVDAVKVDKWDQMLVYGAGKSEVNGVYVKYSGPEVQSVGPLVYVRQLEDIAETPKEDRFWLWRTNMEVKFHTNTCWKISSLPPWELQDTPNGHLDYLYYCLSDDLCPPSVGWKAFDSEDHCPDFEMVEGNIQISGSSRKFLNAVYTPQEDGSWRNQHKSKKRRAWIYRTSVVIKARRQEVWQVAAYPPRKVKEDEHNKYYYRIVADSEEIPGKQEGWKEQEHRSVARPAPLVEPRKWNICYVQFAGRSNVCGAYTRVDEPEYQTESFKGNYIKGDTLEVNSGPFSRDQKGGHFYFRQDKEPHHLIYMLDTKSSKKTRHWVLTSPDATERYYIATQEGKMSNLVQYPPTFGWSCNPTHDEDSDSETGVPLSPDPTSTEIDVDDGVESESESDSGERADDIRHADWPAPVITNFLEPFMPEYVISFRVENYGYHLRMVRDSIEMISSPDPETGEIDESWQEIFEDYEAGDNNFNKMPYKPATILRFIKNAHLHYQLRLSDDKKHIFCFISADDVSMKRWAAYMDHDLMLDPENAINIGRHEVSMLLAKRTLKNGEDTSQVSANFILQGVNDVVDWMKNVFCCGLIGFILDKCACFDILKIFFNKATVKEDKWHNVYVQYSELTREEIFTRYNTDTTDINAAEEPILNIDDANYGDGSIFSPRHRLRIVYEMLTGECFDDPSLPSGAQVRVEEFALTYGHPLEAVFALHDKGIYEELQDNFNMLGVMSLSNATFDQSMKEIRNYYGEEIGYYFAFLRQYTKKLGYPAFFGIIFFILQMSEGEVAIPGISLYIAFVIIWSVVFMEWWQRHELELSNSWGMSRFASKGVPRPQFVGQKVISPVNGKVVEHHRFKPTYYCGLCISYNTVFFFVAIVLVMVVQLFMWRDDMGDQAYYSMLIGGINAIMIQVFNIIYALVSYYLNEWENHRLQPEWDKSMVWKKILFYIVNSFSSLFYIAFIRDSEGSTNEEKLEELQIQLGSLFISMIIVQNITERLLNPIMKCVFDNLPGMAPPSYEAKDEIEHETVITSRITEENMQDAEHQIDLFPAPELLDQMAELIVQYGYVTLFVMAFPLAPLLALINNWVEAYVDTTAWKESQRPIPKGAVGIGEWNTVLELFSYMAVLTNIALVSFRTNNVDENFDIDEKDSEYAHIWFFAAASAAIYFIIVLTKFLDIAACFGVTDVGEHMERSLEIEKNLVAKALKPTLGDGTINDSVFTVVDKKYWNVTNSKGVVYDSFTAYLQKNNFSLIAEDEKGDDDNAKRGPAASSAAFDDDIVKRGPRESSAALQDAEEDANGATIPASGAEDDEKEEAVDEIDVGDTPEPDEPAENEEAVAMAEVET